MEALSVQVRRGDVVEAVHRVHVVSRDAVYGDPTLVCLLRSAAKPIQAIPLIEAYDDLDDDELAIACASHQAEPAQLDAVRKLLDRAGATAEDLEHGTQAGRPEGKLGHNCSGKHAGMLAACRANGWRFEGYRLPEHPLQQRIATLTGAAPTAVDGCGVPTFALRLFEMATLFLRTPARAQGRGRLHARRPSRARAPAARDDRGAADPQQPLRGRRRLRRRVTAVKVFVVSDMEGVAGITKWQQVTGGHAMYEEGRRLYTGEINAAVRGAKAAGASEIVVMDCHGAGEGWNFNSLLPDELDPDCEYVVQNEWTEYVEYLERGVDAALFVAMHAMAGARDGVLAHTVSGSSWWRLRFNGVEVGETGINAALCGHWGCPVLLVTGDEAACCEGRELLGEGLTTVPAKKGLGRFSARQLPAAKARERIEE